MTDLDKKIEILVEEILEPLYDSESLESADWTPQWQHYIDTTEKAEEAIKSLMRTEKLKLLAEVREQIKAGGYEASYEISVVDKLEAEL